MVKAKKSPAQVAETPAAPAPAVEQTQEAAPQEEGPTVLELFAALQERQAAWIKEGQAIHNETRRLQKVVLRELKDANKKNKRRRAKVEGGAKRAPSGFAKPAQISDTLSKFLNVPKGEAIARTEVTKRITAYIKEHNLQDPANKRHIKPDAKLGKLLGIAPNSSDELTYFNLQKYMKPHFPKPATA